MHAAPSPLLSLVLFRQNRKTHRAHETHRIDLFSHVDFDFVSAWFPRTLWRGKREIAAVIFERNVHSILPDHHSGIKAGYRFGEATPEHMESLIMLMKMEHNEDSLRIGTESVGRFYGDDLVRTMNTQFFVESFRRRNGTEQAFRGRVEVIRDDVLGTVLKIGDGEILGDRQLRRLKCRYSRESHDNDCRDCPSP